MELCHRGLLITEHKWERLVALSKDIICGGQSFGILSWTGNESISRNPSGVPILDGFTAYGASKAADLARLCNVFAAVINRAALTSSMGTDPRVERVAVRLLVLLNLRANQLPQ
jgi:hypothetical protein